MAADLLGLAHELAHRREPFALATVVRCERPTSAKAGAKALIRPDGAVSGWIGGSCAEPLVVKEALEALRDGQPRFLVLLGEGGAGPGRREGTREYAMPCHSGGTLEIFVEPILPQPPLVLVGSGPVVETLARLGAAVGLAVTVVEREASARPPEGAEAVVEDLGRVALTSEAIVVVATHGRFDEDALEQALRGDAGYVSLVASPKRAAAVVEALGERGVPADRLGRLKAPAGLDLGAVTPEEIAVSILAEIVRVRRSREPGPRPEAASARPAPRTSLDPVCGMSVEIARTRHSSSVGNALVYFCCGGCKRTFDQDPGKYGAGAPA